MQFPLALRPLAVAVLALGAVAPSPGADTRDARFLEGLRQRQLFELAEKHCADRLAKLPAADVQRAELTIEWIRSLALHATNAPSFDRTKLWQAARMVAADFVRESATHPRAIQVRLQDALTPLAQGELGRQEWEAGALPAAEAEVVHAALREAKSKLQSLDTELTREVPVRRRVAARAGELSADQLFALQQHVQHQLARAQRNQALLFAPGSDDRLALLLAAVETLQRPLAQLAAEEPLRPAIQLDLAECQRLLGKYDEAGELCAPLAAEGVAPATRLRARAELIRVAIAQRQPAVVERLLEQGRQADGQSSAELDFAWFEALLTLSRSASEGIRLANPEKLTPSELAQKYADQAAETADFLEETYGNYWGRRADQLLVASLPRGVALANAELLARSADSLYLQGERDAAIAAYDEAAAAARAKNDLLTAFDVAYKAALIEQHRQRHKSAATRLRILAKSLATHEQASAAHLLAAWNAAQQARTDASAAAGYAEILREHLATFSTADSANQARLWLGKLHASQEAWADAIEAYAGVQPASEHYPQAALAAAELILLWQPDRASDAEKLLRTGLEQADKAPPAWRTAAQAQLVVALASQPGREDESLTVLRQIGDTSPLQLLGVLESLSQVSARASQQQRPLIAKVELAAADALLPARPQLPPESQARLDRIRAASLAAMGRRDDALDAYVALAKAHPNDAAIQQGYAELLLNSTEIADLEQALQQWRRVASRTKPRTEPWYRAKYSVAQAQFKLGDKGGAATLLRFLLDTPPGLKETAWESQYRSLLAQCEP